MVAGSVAGFLCFAGYYLAVVPNEFITQTLLWQQARPGGEFPSLVALMRMAPLVSGFFRMSCLSVVFVLPLLLILLNRRVFTIQTSLLVVVLAVTVLLSQSFFHLPRYYAAIYPFMKRHTYLPQVFLGLAFGWAIPMAFAAQTGEVPVVAWLLLIATVLWATAYDSMYAMVDIVDDLKIGV